VDERRNVPNVEQGARIPSNSRFIPQYAQLSIDPSLTQLCAMSSSRAAG
jgi:hypothetical protein